MSVGVFLVFAIGFVFMISGFGCLVSRDFGFAKGFRIFFFDFVRFEFSVARFAKWVAIFFFRLVGVC